MPRRLCRPPGGRNRRLRGRCCGEGVTAAASSWLASSWLRPIPAPGGRAACHLAGRDDLQRPAARPAGQNRPTVSESPSSQAHLADILISPRRSGSRRLFAAASGGALKIARKAWVRCLCCGPAGRGGLRRGQAMVMAARMASAARAIRARAVKLGTGSGTAFGHERDDDARGAGRDATLVGPSPGGHHLARGGRSQRSIRLPRRRMWPFGRPGVHEEDSRCPSRSGRCIWRCLADDLVRLGP